RGVRNEVGPRPGRDDDDRYTKSTLIEVTRYPTSGRPWRNRVGFDLARRPNMIVQASAFVVGENESRVCPRRALHEWNDDVVDCVGRSLLDVGVGMFIQSDGSTALNKDHLRQIGLILNVSLPIGCVTVSC